MNEQFTLPDGTTVGTGNIEPTADQMAMCKADYRVFGEDYYLDKPDIEKLLKNDRYKEQRKQRAPYVINQGPIGKCNASATEAGLHQVRANAGLPNVVLSDSHLYMRINGGGDNGSMLIDGFKELARNGVSPRTIESQGKTYTIPHNAYLKKQIPSGWLDVANKIGTQYRSFEAFTLPDDYPTFKIAVASALARNYPIVFAWHVGNAGMRLSNGYVNNGHGVGNHANLAHSGKWVGGEDLVHADDQNSWGPTADEAYGPKGSAWGDGGFGLFTMESFFRCRKKPYVLGTCRSDTGAICQSVGVNHVQVFACDCRLFDLLGSAPAWLPRNRRTVSQADGRTAREEATTLAGFPRTSI